MFDQGGNIDGITSEGDFGPRYHLSTAAGRIKLDETDSPQF
jgi:hypothetical protein